MAAVVRRNTSAFPIARAQELLAFAAAGWKLGRVDVVLRSRGDSWISGHAAPESRRPRIVVSIGRCWKRTRYQLSYARTELVEGSLEEAVLYVLAHEVRHIIQARYARPRGWVWGARGQYSERDAEAFGLRVVRRWRREGGFANG